MSAFMAHVKCADSHDIARYVLVLWVSGFLLPSPNGWLHVNMNQETTMNAESATRYGVGDASYQAVGELPGLTRLVDDFYDIMDTIPEAKGIRAMHSGNMVEIRKKLTYFLAGWLGGPRLYRQEYGPIHIPMAHRDMAIGEEERDAWMLCMQKAVAKQPFAESFKEYLIAQLWVPAERIRMVCGR